MEAILNIFRKKPTENFMMHGKEQKETEKISIELKKHIDTIFGRSLAIREVDSGSDNSTEIELVNLTTPHYDIERFGISFVASPRHADAMIVTGAVTHNMEFALRKAYDAMPAPKLVIAVGNDACNGGIFREGYAVNNGVEEILPVDMKIPGNPPTPKEILLGLLALMKKIRHEREKGK
ncbi:NADH-quinone oxidoreductase subunit B family protein [Candidatus Woesearchaeota archaeon]|nr:NADH-quinone oxidoreductase subunit B family protein [Candidatus Woesearchaeota archaeon]